MRGRRTRSGRRSRWMWIGVGSGDGSKSGQIRPEASNGRTRVPRRGPHPVAKKAAQTAAPLLRDGPPPLREGGWLANVRCTLRRHVQSGLGAPGGNRPSSRDSLPDAPRSTSYPPSLAGPGTGEGGGSQAAGWGSSPRATPRRSDDSMAVKPRGRGDLSPRPRLAEPYRPQALRARPVSRSRVSSRTTSSKREPTMLRAMLSFSSPNLPSMTRTTSSGTRSASFAGKVAYS